jgi:hypothetical protein
MPYILLGSDKPKVYIKICKESESELCHIKETDFIRYMSNCHECLYFAICFLSQKK